MIHENSNLYDRLQEELGREPTRQERRAFAAAISREAKRHPTFLIRQEIPAHISNDPDSVGLVEVWRSRKYLVQVYDIGGDVLRMTVNLTKIKGQRWQDGISWEDLQSLKHQIGRGHLEGVEIYPAETSIVNVANLRHLWILKNGRMPFGLDSDRHNCSTNAGIS